MSTYWGYRCTVDGAQSEQPLNRGQDTLREIAAAAPLLKDAQKLADYGFEITHWTTSSHALILFVLDHLDHQLELLNEYGDVEPLGQACGVPHGLLPIACARSNGHWGRHEAEWEIVAERVVRHQSRVQWNGPVPADFGLVDLARMQVQLP